MKQPKVTVGLLAYNEALHVRSAIQSITDQSFSDFEILVGNNKSTDGTTEIVAEMAQRDQRIRHIVHPVNIGAVQNWNRLIQLAHGQYFVLAGGHDLWTSDYLEKLVAELDSNHHAVIAFAKTEWIDEDGGILDVPTNIVDTSGMSRFSRFLALMIANQNYLYGLMRLDVLKSIRPQLEILGSGEILLQELASFGAFVLVEGPRWCRRETRARESAIERRIRYSRVLFSSPVRRLQFRLFPGLQMLAVYLALPFTMKNMNWRQRASLITTYPVLLFLFKSRIIPDFIWLVWPNRGGKKK